MCLISAITVAASAPPLWNHTVMPTTDWRAQIPEFLQNSLKVDLKFLCLQSTDNFFYNISSKGHVCGGKSEAYFYLHTPSSNLEVTGCGRTLLLLFFFFSSLTIYITSCILWPQTCLPYKCRLQGRPFMSVDQSEVCV